MRLYTRTGATVLDDPEFGRFDADELGGFDFPNELSDRLHGFAVRGQRLWETDVERQHRLMAEELERRRDPATLMAAVQQLVEAASRQGSTGSQAAVQPAEAEPAAPKAPRAPRTRRSSTSTD